MCRTVHAVLQTLICGVQMLVRVLMTVLLMIENLIRMILQTLYNFISFMLQLLSLIPICVVFLVSARLKCFMCGGGGGCQPGRGGACDCIMSLVAIVILFFIFKSTGVMDKIFYSMGYAKAAYESEPYVPTPGDITECSRNDTDQDIEYLVRTETYTASAETTAAKYLNTLVEDYIETIVTQRKIVETPEPEVTGVPFTTKVVGIMTILTMPVADVVTSLTTVASDIETTSITPEIVKPATIDVEDVIETTKVIYTTAPEAAAVATTKTAYIEAFETTKIATTEIDHTTGYDATELVTSEADETVTDVAEIVTETMTVTTTLENIVDEATTQVKEAIESVTFTATPFNEATEAPDMGMPDTPFNEEQTTE